LKKKKKKKKEEEEEEKEKKKKWLCFVYRNLFLCFFHLRMQ